MPNIARATPIEPAAIWKRNPSATSAAVQAKPVNWTRNTITTAKAVTRSTRTVETFSTISYLLARWMPMATSTMIRTQRPIDNVENGSPPMGRSITLRVLT